MKTGAGGLAWWRIRGSDLATSSTGQEFQQTFRAQSLQSGMHERTLTDAVGNLRAAGIEPLLAKGWLAAW